MSKNKKLEKNKKVLTTKEMLIKYAKRYGIVLLISFPIIAIISYILATNFSWYSGVVSFISSFAMLLLACLIGLIIFTKMDDKAKENSTPEKEHDPFAD